MRTTDTSNCPGDSHIVFLYRPSITKGSISFESIDIAQPAMRISLDRQIKKKQADKLRKVAIVRQLISSEPSEHCGRPSQRLLLSRHNPSLHRNIPAGHSLTTNTIPKNSQVVFHQSISCNGAYTDEEKMTLPTESMSTFNYHMQITFVINIYSNVFIQEKLKLLKEAYETPLPLLALGFFACTLVH